MSISDWSFISDWWVSDNLTGLSTFYSGVRADGRGIDRIRLLHISDTSEARLIAFIEDIEPGSTVNPDGWYGYPLRMAAYRCAHDGRHPRSCAHGRIRDFTISCAGRPGLVCESMPTRERP